jgi:AcrR family transcriptional regulator
MTAEDVSTTVQAAVDRALSGQRAEAVREVEAILDAALRVAERVAPAVPRVADIVAEAKTSNQAFYRYFAGKDDLMRAVLERGVTRLYSYLEHQIGKADDPAGQIEAWIRGVLAQVTNRRAAWQSAAVAGQLGQGDATDETGLLLAAGSLLVAPVAQAGSVDAERDAALISAAAFGVLRRHVRQGSAPSPAECDHVVAFCLRGLTVEPADERAPLAQRVRTGRVAADHDAQAGHVMARALSRREAEHPGEHRGGEVRVGRPVPLDQL